MTDLTVVLAPSGALAGVRDALHDWSADGLVSRFLWVEPHMVTGGDVHAISVADGRLQAVTLNQLAGVGRFDRLRIATLVPAVCGLGPVPLELAQNVAQQLDESFGAVPVSRVRVLITRIGDATTVDDVAVDGWHNVALSPEDSTGPGVGASQLHATEDVVDLGRHAASGLAGLLGLWVGCTEGPLDDEPVLPGRLVRLSRSYYRRLRTDAVEAELRERVLSMADGFPLPNLVGTETTYVEDSALATRTMSDQLWSRHPQVLRGPREQVPPVRTRAVSVGEAFGMFFGFLWAALRNAPRSWVAGVVLKVKADTAAAVHAVVFGAAPSAYAVVVRGVTADGTPAGWHDLAAATEALDRVLDSAGQQREHEVAADLSGLWRDYVAGALTLADAGERVPWLPPVQIGMQRGVLRGPELVAPSAPFTDVPAHLVSALGTPTVAPYDVLGSHDLEGRLRSLAQQPSSGLQASTALQSLVSWRARVATTFTVQVGTRIAQGLHAAVEESRALLDQIRQAADAQDALTAVQARQKKVARTLQVISLVGVVLLVVVTALAVSEVLTATATAIIVAAVLLGWLGTAFLVFFRGQRDLFQLINARRQLLATEEVTRANLRHALRDSRRLGQAYSQYLCWSSILAGVLGEPFGRSEATGPVRESVVTDLPHSVRLGTVAADAATVASAATVLRRDVFPAGWLTGCWEGAIASAHQQIGAHAVNLQADPGQIYRERADTTHQLLPGWAELVRRSGIDAAIGDVQWALVVTALDGPREAVAQNLFAQVWDTGRSLTSPESHESFIGGLDDPARFGPQRLADAILTDSARARGASQVVISRPSVSRSGLNEVVSLTQLSEGMSRFDLLAQAPHTAQDWNAAEPQVPEIFGGLPF